MPRHLHCHDPCNAQSHAQAPAPRSREERLENVMRCAEDAVVHAADGCADVINQ